MIDPHLCSLSGLPYTLGSEDLAVSILLILLFLGLNGAFHAAEAAIASLRRTRVSQLLSENSPSAHRLRKLYDSQHQYFAACQIGFQLSRLGIVGVCFLLAPSLAEKLAGASYNAWSLLMALAIIIVPIGLINLLAAELFSRAIAKKKPETWSLRLYRFVVASHLLLLPAAWLVKAVGSPLLRKLGHGELFAPQVITEHELMELVTASGESGELIEDEKDMIHSIFEFTDTVAREVMTPRTDIDAADVDASPAEIVELIRSSGHTRIPVYEESIDRIVGLVHAKDLLQVIANNGTTTTRSIMRPAYSIPETKSLHQLLREFRKGRTQLAIVQDKYGGTSGLVTIEDVVEEIVGDIVDEYDIEEQAFLFLEDGSWLIDGKQHLWDVNDEIGSHFESEEFDTLGGFLFGLFGRQPEKGDQIESNGYQLSVEETDGRRIQKVRLTKIAPVIRETS